MKTTLCIILISILAACTSQAQANGALVIDRHGDVYGSTSSGEPVRLYTDRFGTYGQIGEDRVDLRRDHFGSYGTIGDERVTIWDDRRQDAGRYDRGDRGDDHHRYR